MSCCNLSTVDHPRPEKHAVASSCGGVERTRLLLANTFSQQCTYASSKNKRNNCCDTLAQWPRNCPETKLAQATQNQTTKQKHKNVHLTFPHHERKQMDDCDGFGRHLHLHHGQARCRGAYQRRLQTADQQRCLAGQIVSHAFQHAASHQGPHSSCTIGSLRIYMCYVCFVM